MSTRDPVQEVSDLALQMLLRAAAKDSDGATEAWDRLAKVAGDDLLRMEFSVMMGWGALICTHTDRDPDATFAVDVEQPRKRRVGEPSADAAEAAAAVIAAAGNHDARGALELWLALSDDGAAECLGMVFQMAVVCVRDVLPNPESHS